MMIAYDESGAILIAGLPGQVDGENVIEVDDIPADFLETFALGKYHVFDGAVMENDGFTPPKILTPEEIIAKLRSQLTH